MPKAEAEENARLIVAAVNACFAINPSNPLAVAEAMGEVVEALRRIADGQWPSDIAETEGTLAMREVARAALAKLEAK